MTFSTLRSHSILNGGIHCAARTVCSIRALAWFGTGQFNPHPSRLVFTIDPVPAVQHRRILANKPTNPLYMYIYIHHTYITYIVCVCMYLLLLISMLWHRQAIFESKGDKLSSSAEGRIRTQRVSDTYSPADRMPADKLTELSRIKLKTWTRQPVPMISKHSAHLTPLPFGIRTWLWRYTYLLLLISMLWHRQAIFEFERRQVVFLCWRQDSNPEGLRHLFASRPNACWQTDWAIEDQAKNLNSTARPHDQQAFSPPDPTAIWHSHLALAIYIFVVVNFDALAQASDIRIERRQVIFLCWRQDSNPEGLRHLFASRPNACWQTDWAIEDQAKNLNSAARPHDQQAFSPPEPTAIWHSHLALAIYIFVVVNFDALAQCVCVWHGTMHMDTYHICDHMIAYCTSGNT